MALFECRAEFERVRLVFNSPDRTGAFRKVIQQCNNSQNLSYAFLCCFIEYYSRFSQPNTDKDLDFVRIIEHDFSGDLIKLFTPLGHQYLVGLCSNFSNESYFRLYPGMQPDDIHKRLILLNIVAVFISYKLASNSTLLSNILFDNQRHMPGNYCQHLSTICLPGLKMSNLIISQMMYVRTRVQERLDQGKYFVDYGKFIFQCSEQCPWMFFFEDCGAPVGRSICSLCQKDIGAKAYNVLIDRDPPQLRIPIPKAFEKIDEYIKKENQAIHFGYHNVKNPGESSLADKADHLNRPISFRFIHFLIHGLLHFLSDRRYLTDNDLKENLKLPTNTYFHDHYEKDYQVLCQATTDSEQCYLWIYKLLNHLVDDKFNIEGRLYTNENLIKVEQLIEQKLIFKHIDSIDNEITDYKKAYAEVIQKQQSIESFADELFEDEQRFPYLNFFNVTTFHTSNPLDEFTLKMENLPFAEKTYPITTYLLRRLDDYSNIQHLYSIVTFSNYLIDKLNHRIKRNDAVHLKIIYYLTQDNDREMTKRLFDDFLEAWYAISLKEFRYGCQRLPFENAVSKENFAENTSIAMLLLTTSRDATILLPACLKTIAELQNEIVNYFQNSIETKSPVTTKRKRVPLQSIRKEHIFDFDRMKLSQKLIRDSTVINYQYGKSKDLIYDYEEIEITLRNIISKLVLIDTEKINFLTYQFELYNENTSLINEVRLRVRPQQRFADEDRNKFKNLIITMEPNHILACLGSLDNMFTYIRMISEDRFRDNMSIQIFVERFMRSKSRTNDILNWPQFSAIQLQYIIDFYEIFEEIAFDKVLRAYVNKELAEESFSEEDRKRIIEIFSGATFKHENIGATLKSVNVWISVLKRLMVRILNANVPLDTPIQIYLERADLWSDTIDTIHLSTFEISDEILLQHTYVILSGLENMQKAAEQSLQESTKAAPLSVKGQKEKTKTWFDQAKKGKPSTKELSNTKISKNALRA